MRKRPTGRDGNNFMIYKFDGGTPWLLFQVVDGFVKKSEDPSAGGAIHVNGHITVCAALSGGEEMMVYKQAATARLTTIDGLLEFLREHLEAVGT